MLCAEGRRDITEHLRRLPVGFYNSRDPGDIGAYIVSDYANIESVVTHLIPQFFGALIMPLVALIGLAFCNWQLALAAALVIPVLFPFVKLATFIIRSAGKKQQTAKVAAASRMIEYIQGIKLIKAFNLEGTKFERLETSFHNLMRSSIRLEAASGPTIILASIVLNAGLVLIILLGMVLFFEGTLSLPFYIMFLILGTRIYEPLLQAMLFLGELSYMELGVERIENLRKSPLLTEGSKDETFDSFGIEFRDVSFKYNDVQVINRLNLHIPAQKLTALVGTSGSGKTTLTRLIARFWDVEQGDILIGGKSIKAYVTDNLLSNISMVFQDVYLFNDTVRNNIRIGKEDATQEEIEAAARAAQCHDFIKALPDGYDTMVGEVGNTLSGGEKQRISIACAILKNAPVILLDEATAALDPENEFFIQKAISDLVRNKTVVVIAHRLNAIRQADKIVVIDKGAVAEEGTHEQLLANGGLYKSLWDEQQRVKGWKF
ncbi:MAG: ABC transporter ATP-binding protein/permease [Prevotellaceae bacterium]|nr:ABC transporter ATP-binding protein/permease [Prevotellaceae bacterium]